MEPRDGQVMDGKCSATNKTGAPCSAAAWRDGLCRWHHPDLAGKVAEGRRRGGVNKSSKARAAKRLPDEVLTTEQLRGVLGKTLQDVISGKLEPAVGNAAASLARAYVAVTEAGAVEELTQRLDELERQARGRPA